MSTGRFVAPGRTRSCPHCKATILDSAAVCPGCHHHLRFDSASGQRPQTAETPLRVDGILRHTAEGGAWEYSIVLVVRNGRGEEISRQVVGVGALQPAEERTFSLAVEVFRPAAAAPAPAAATSPAGADRSAAELPVAAAPPATTAPVAATTSSAAGTPPAVGGASGSGSGTQALPRAPSTPGASSPPGGPSPTGGRAAPPAPSAAAAVPRSAGSAAFPSRPGSAAPGLPRSPDPLAVAAGRASPSGLGREPPRQPAGLARDPRAPASDPRLNPKRP